MSLLLEEESPEVKAIKLHLAAAKQKVSIAKEHAEWSNYQLDQSKKHLKDTEKKLREAKRGVDIIDNAAADNEDSKQEASNSSGPKRISLQRGFCVIAHGAKRKLCSHPGCTNWAIRFASACSLHGPGGRKNAQAGELLIKNTDKSSSSTGEKRDNKQEVLLQQPPVKKRKRTDISEGAKKPNKLSKSEYDKARREAMKTGTWNPDPRYQPKPKPPQQPPMKKRKTDISEGGKKAKKLSKLEYDKARREAMKDGTWNPDPRYQPKPKPPPPSQCQLPSTKKLSKSAYDKARREAMKAGTWKPDPSKQPKRMRNGTHNTLVSGSGNTGSGIEMLTKAAESDLLHSLFKSNSRVAKDDNNMDEDTTEATQLDDISRCSGRKRTPSSKKREATT